MSADLKSDAELKKLAETFFVAALKAVGTNAEQVREAINNRRFRIVKDIFFEDNEATRRLQHEMVSRCIKLLGPKIGHEREISALAWEQVADHLAQQPSGADPKAVFAAFLEALRVHVQLKFVYVMSNYAIQFRESARTITIGPVQAVLTSDLLPELLREKTNPRWTVKTGAEFRVGTNPSGIEFQLPPIVWRVSVHAAKGFAEEEAAWLINVALSFLRLSYPDGRYDFFPDLGDREALPLDAPHWESRGLIFAERGVTGGGWALPNVYVVDDSIVAMSVTRKFQKRAEAIFAPGKGSLSERFGAGLGWLTRGRQSADRAERFLYFFTAVEALLSNDDKTAPVVQTIARYASVILQDDASGRIGIAKEVKSLYESRSALVHAGKREVTQSAVNTIQHIAEHLYKTVMEKIELTMAFTTFQKTLSDASYGLPWPSS